MIHAPGAPELQVLHQSEHPEQLEGVHGRPGHLGLPLLLRRWPR